MKITEVKLKQVILEEVATRLLEQIIEEELGRFFLENETDEDLMAYKKAYRSDLVSKVKKGLVPMALVGTLFGILNQKTTDYQDIKAAETELIQKANMEKANSDEAQFEELVDQLNNQYAYRWGKGNDSVIHAPGSDGKVTVLPPSYSVMVKVMQDKKANADRIEQGLKPVERYGKIDLDTDLDHGRQYQGDYESNIDNFFQTHKGNFVDAMDVLGAHDELQVVPGSGMEQGIIMVNPDEISGDFYLPELGMTAADYYNYQYGEYMGSGESAALDGPEDDETFNPDTEINPEIVQNTNKRVQRNVDNLQKKRLKESRVTWKNYKNRQKKLA